MFTQHQSSTTGAPSCPVGSVAPVATGTPAGGSLGSPSAGPAVVSMPLSTPCAAQECACKIALSDLPRGGNAIIRDIRAQGMLGRRLRDMGLLPGVAVELVSRAPLGDPLVVALDGYTLSVRCAEAACVMVEKTQ